MNSQEYEVTVRRIRESQQARDFLPFFRTTLKPLLEHAVLDSLTNENATEDRQLVRIQAFAKMIKDIELLMNRLIIQGETIEKAAAKSGGSRDADT